MHSGGRSTVAAVRGGGWRRDISELAVAASGEAYARIITTRMTFVHIFFTGCSVNYSGKGGVSCNSAVSTLIIGGGRAEPYLHHNRILLDDS